MSQTTHEEMKAMIEDARVMIASMDVGGALLKLDAVEEQLDELKEE